MSDSEKSTESKVFILGIMGGLVIAIIFTLIIVAASGILNTASTSKEPVQNAVQVFTVEKTSFASVTWFKSIGGEIYFIDVQIPTDLGYVTVNAVMIDSKKTDSGLMDVNISIVLDNSLVASAISVSYKKEIDARTNILHADKVTVWVTTEEALGKWNAWLETYRTAINPTPSQTIAPLQDVLPPTD